MAGIGDDIFAPSGTLTRPMAAQILYNIEKPEADNVDSGFANADPDTWYTKVKNWPALSGVINGIGDDRFDPAANITREQVVTMLYNYAR